MRSFLFSVPFLFLAAQVSAQCQSLASLSWSFRPTIASSVSSRVVYKQLSRPRGIKFDAAGNLLVVEAGTGLSVLTYRNTSSCVGWEKKSLIRNANFNHGVDIDGNTLYVSSEENVFEYKYDPWTQTVTNATGRTLVYGMDNPSFDHTSRTLVFQAGSPPYLIVSRGSDNNYDLPAAQASTGRAQIRRFNLNTVPSGGYSFTSGQLVAYGTRNAVGMVIGRNNKLWEVENSSDNINWNGRDIHQDNPSEELNVIDLNNITGGYYGYPYCFTSWDMASFSGPQTGSGIAYAASGSTYNDQSCNNSIILPRLNLPAHTAPLDIKFYFGASLSNPYGLQNWVEDAFVSFHGSWNRQPPIGYGVVRIPWNATAGGPVAGPTSRTGFEYLLQASNMNSCPNSCIRPVGLDFDYLGRLFVSSDTTGEVFIIQNPTSPEA